MGVGGGSNYLINTIMQKYALTPSDTKSGEKTVNQEVELGSRFSTFNTTSTENTVKLNTKSCEKIENQEVELGSRFSTFNTTSTENIAKLT